METNENEDTTVQNLWDTAKAVLRGKYTAIQASLKKLEKTQIHKLITSHLICRQWNITQPLEMTNTHHLLQRGWTWRVLC